ncbi:MAG TPA: hypothetical protein VHP13_07945 [Gammaproteobacteria bacterium]|jgi:hypothetical protein|nr:hypothetical protein [Gammaproteobacteria bacterium]
MLGDFLELSLSTADMLGSMEFYRKLGFHEAAVGGSWNHPYMVFTDGRIHVGLHKREPRPPALSFVLPDLRARMAGFEAMGLEFAWCEIGLDQFHHLGFDDPDQGQVALVEARTFSPVHPSHLMPSLCGYFTEYRLPARDLDASARFWESLGLIVEPGGADYIQASWGGINLGLQRPQGRARPTLVFESANPEEAGALLEVRGLPVRPDPEGLRVPTPEGIELLLRPERP